MLEVHPSLDDKNVDILRQARIFDVITALDGNGDVAAKVAQLRAHYPEHPLPRFLEARYVLDGVEMGMGGTQTSTPGYPGPWQHFVVIAGTDAPQELRYQLRDSSNAGATMRGLTVAALPFAASDIAYASNDPPHDVISMTATADSVLSLGPLGGVSFIL